MLFSLYVKFGTNADTDKYIICICARAKKVFLNDRDNLYLGLFEGGKKIEEQEAPSFFFYLSFARGNVQKRMV